MPSKIVQNRILEKKLVMKKAVRIVIDRDILFILFNLIVLKYLKYLQNSNFCSEKLTKMIN